MLLFVDDSGKLSNKKTSNKFVIYSGLFFLNEIDYENFNIKYKKTLINTFSTFKEIKGNKIWNTNYYTETNRNKLFNSISYFECSFFALVIDRDKLKKNIKTEKDAEGVLNFFLLYFIDKICKYKDFKNIELTLIIDNCARPQYGYKLFEWMNNSIINYRHWKCCRDLQQKNIMISPKSKIVDSKEYIGIQFVDFISNTVFKFKNNTTSPLNFKKIFESQTTKKVKIFHYPYFF